MWKSGYRFPYSFIRDYRRPSFWYYNLKYAYQRMRRGWSDLDSGGHLGSHIVNIIRKALPQHTNINSEHVIYLLPEDYAACNGPLPTKDKECKEAMARWDAMVLGIVDDLRYYDNSLVVESGPNMVQELNEKEDREDAAVQLFAKYHRYFWN
jgi:hypothetical protein